MPIPKPKPLEPERSFVPRCIRSLLVDGFDNEQSAAICHREYITKGDGKAASYDDIPEDQFVIQPYLYDDDQLIRDIYSGEVSPLSLPQSLFSYTALSLMANLWLSFGLPSDFTISKAKNKFTKKERVNRARLAKLSKNNLSLFSGAKTFQNIVTLSNSVFDNDGVKRSFDEFSAIAKGVNEEYNVNWLMAENVAAFRQAEAMESWSIIESEKDTFPYLTYVTVGDERVREEHRTKDGLTYPVGHPFWNTWFPPNGWLCRCIAIRETRAGKAKDEFEENIDPVFGTNVGKTGLIFPEKHPYFDIPDEFKRAKNRNFGFKDPTDDDIINAATNKD